MIKYENNKIKHLTCIICPLGCQLEISIPDNYNEENKRTFDSSVFKVTGNSCKRGDTYARKELTTPERTLTCTVAVAEGKRSLVSAKTNGEVPKEKLLDCMEVVRRLTVKAPVTKGQILLKDLLKTGIDLVACENVAR